jgi:hypothetical protein
MRTAAADRNALSDGWAGRGRHARRKIRGSLRSPERIVARNLFLHMMPPGTERVVGSDGLFI